MHRRDDSRAVTDSYRRRSPPGKFLRSYHITRVASDIESINSSMHVLTLYSQS
jgi:hypothetical protein